MRKELQEIEKIEQYLEDRLSTSEKFAFEAELANDPILQSHVNFQADLVSNLQRSGLRSSTKAAYKKYLIKKIAWISAVVIGVLTFITIATIYFSPSNNLPKEENKMEFGTDLESTISTGWQDHLVEEDSLCNESDTSSTPVDELDLLRSEAFQPVLAPVNSIYLPENDPLFAEANELLNQELFEINAARDTVIESENGIVVYIPARAFDTPNEQVDFMLQEAMTPAAIMYSGLNTMTETGEELETGGMFYLDAFANGKRIGLLKKLTVDIPGDPTKTGMQLYEGAKDRTGQILWKNPKDIIRPLIPVEITSLDFYPPGYEKQMNAWGYLNKIFIDSLYYSFAGDCREELKVGDLSSEEFGIGERLFKQNCASCHFPNKAMTGPALKGARERWIANSTEENFYAWIKNSGGVIASGDRYANELYTAWNKAAMTSQNLTNDQIDLLFRYVESAPNNEINLIPPLQVKSKRNPERSERKISEESEDALLSEQVDSVAFTSSDCGVNPASVQTIWNKKFNLTNLATKEFEARMPWIHRTCNTTILDLYVNNLDKHLYEIDLLAAAQLDGNLKTKFIQFAALKQGKVETNSTAQKELNAYYLTKRKALENIVKRTNDAYWKKQDVLDRAMNQQTTAANERYLSSKNQISEQELAYNTARVYRELGLEKPIPRANPLVQFANRDVQQNRSRPATALQANRPVLRANISTLGWRNVDCLLSVSQNRESVAIQGNGRTTSLTYSPLSLTVQNANDFNKINVYIVPKAFNSFIKLNGNGINYNYSLNNNLSYQTIAIAWSEEGFYVYQNENTEKGSRTIILEKMEKEEWQLIIKTHVNAINGMSAEIDYLDYLRKDEKRQNSNNDKRNLVQKARPYVFPCSIPEARDTSSNLSPVSPFH